MEYIGIDIGTSSICGIAYNPSDKSSKTIVKEKQRKLGFKLSVGENPRPGTDLSHR